MGSGEWGQDGREQEESCGRNITELIGHSCLSQCPRPFHSPSSQDSREQGWSNFHITFHASPTCGDPRKRCLCWPSIFFSEMPPEIDEGKVAMGRTGRALRATGLGVKSCEKLGVWNTFLGAGTREQALYDMGLPPHLLEQSHSNVRVHVLWFL